MKIFIISKISFILVIWISSIYILSGADKKDKEEPIKVFGNKNLGLLFKTEISFREPISTPNSFPQKEYWKKDGSIWIYNASIKNRNFKKTSDIDLIIKNFFFPEQFKNLKKIQGNKKAEKTIIIFKGIVSIDNIKKNVFLKYVLGKKYLHIIFIFYEKKLEKKASEILKSTAMNPNFSEF